MFTLVLVLSGAGIFFAGVVVGLAIGRYQSLTRELREMRARNAELVETMKLKPNTRAVMTVREKADDVLTYVMDLLDDLNAASARARMIQAATNDIPESLKETKRPNITNRPT